MRHLSPESTTWLRRAGALAIAAWAVIATASCSSNDEALEVISLSPSTGSARGGDSVRVVGSGFAEGATVSFGGDPAPAVGWVSEAEIVAETPWRLAGPVDVTVQNPDGESATATAAFWFEPLELEFVAAAPYYLPDLSERVVSDAASADVDLDGDVDLLVAVVGGPSLVLRNQGTGSFIDESAPVATGGSGGASAGGAGGAAQGGAGGSSAGGSSGAGGAGTGAGATGPTPDAGVPEPVDTWVHDSARMLVEDLDEDGSMDVLLCNRSGQPHRVLLNDGTGQFVDSPGAFAEISDECRGAALLDLDGDGLRDLVVAGRGPAGSGNGYVRIYLRSGSGAPSYELAEQLEAPAAIDGAACGSIEPSDPAIVASYQLTETEVASGLGAAVADYDFTAAPGRVAFVHSLPPVARIPDEVTLQLAGDGAGATVALRVVDASGEQFEAPTQSVDWSGWRQVRFDQLASWPGTGGNADGVIDLPLASLALVVEPGAATAGSLGVDDIRLEVPDVGLVIVDDFERRDMQLAWAGSIDSVTAADLDGDGDEDLVVSSDAAAGEAKLRVILNERTGDGGELRLRELPGGALAAVAERISYCLATDVDGDGALDLFAVASNGQDRLLLNDGSGHFYDDTAALLPVDRSTGRFAAEADFDLDGLEDLAIANDGAVTRLYVSQGPDGYLDATPALPLVPSRALRVVPLDIDGDRDLDLFVLNQQGERSFLYVSIEPLGHPN